MMLAALTALLLVVRAGVTFRAALLLGPVALLFVLVWYLTSDDSEPARAVVRTGLAALVFSFVVHVFGPHVVAALGYAGNTWPYQIKGMLKHSGELAGWMLVAIGIFQARPHTGSIERQREPTHRVRTAAEIVATYCRARWWLFRLPFPAAVAAARDVTPSTPGGSTAEEQTATGLRLGRAVERTLRLVPFDSRCLVKALVLTRMLSRRGIDSSFVLGVRAPSDFAAHAWLERDGVALLPTGTEFHRLTEF
jgi:hypothetical protein